MKHTLALLLGLAALLLCADGQTSTIEGLTDATTLADGDKAWVVDVSESGASRDVDATLLQLKDYFFDVTASETISGTWDFTSMGDITFKSGAQGGTIRTGTTAADKFRLQAWDNNDSTYRTLLEADAGNEPLLQLFTDYLHIEDDADPSKEIGFDLSGATTSTKTTLAFTQTANGTVTFPESGTLAVEENLGTAAAADLFSDGGDVVTYTTSAMNAGEFMRYDGFGSISPASINDILSYINVEAGADVTDATNVTAAGALMDSEVTNLAQVKAFDTTDYEPAGVAAADITDATADGIALITSADANPFADADEAKLDGLEYSPLGSPYFTSAAFTSLSPTIARVGTSGCYPIVGGMPEDMHSDLYRDSTDDFTFVIKYIINPRASAEDMTLFSVGQFESTLGECGYLGRITAAGEYQVITYGSTTTTVTTTGQGISAGDIGTVIFRKNGTTLEILDGDMVQLASGTSDADLDDLSGTTTAARLMTIIGGTYDDDGITIGSTVQWPDDVFHGIFYEYYAWPSAITDAQMASGLNELNGRRSYARLTATKDSRNPVITKAQLDQAWNGNVTIGRYAVPLKISNNNFLLTYNCYSGVSGTSMTDGFANLAVSADGDSWTFPRLRLGEVYSGDGNNNNMFLQYYNYKDIIEDPLDSDSWLLFSESASASAGGASGSYIHRVPKDFSSLASLVVKTNASNSESKTLWNWQGSGKLAFFYKSAPTQFNNSTNPYPDDARTMVLAVSDDTDYATASNWTGYGLAPEFTSWRPDQQFYSIQVFEYGGAYCAISSQYDNGEDQIYSLGMYVSEDGRLWECVDPYMLTAGSDPGDWDYGTIQTTQPIILPDGSMRLIYVGSNGLHDSLVHGEYGYAEIDRNILDIAIKNLLDPDTLTGLDRRAYFFNNANIALSSDITMSGAFELNFKGMFEALGTRAVLGHDTLNGGVSTLSTTQVRVYNDAGSAASFAFTPELQTEYDYRIVRDGSNNISLYINGSLISTTTLSGTISINRFGGDAASPALSMEGSISNLRFDLGDDGTDDHVFAGDGILTSNWTDSVGSITPTVSSGVRLLHYRLRSYPTTISNF